MTKLPHDESMVGPTWCDFVSEIQIGLDTAYLGKEDNFRYDCFGNNYIVDFLMGKQINTKSGVQRDVRRVWVSYPPIPPDIEQYVPPPPKGKGHGKSGKYA